MKKGLTQLENVAVEEVDKRPAVANPVLQSRTYTRAKPDRLCCWELNNACAHLKKEREGINMRK